MSRPFSYNDENFTVIGNILFVHAIIDGNSYSFGKTVAIIPQAIFTRLTSYTQIASVSNKSTNDSAILIFVDCKSDGSLVTRTAIKEDSSSQRFVLTFFYLKDI